MPREIYLRLKFYGKSKDGYKADEDTAWLLKKHCDWRLEKKGRNYSYIKPPKDYPKGNEVDVKLSVPTNAEILDVTNKMHAAAIPNTPELRVEYDWPFLYTPAHTQTEIETEIDGFTGIEGKSEKYVRHIEAQCLVGFPLIWQAKVYWKNGEPEIKIYSPCEIQDSQKEEQTTFFDTTPKFKEGAQEQILVNRYERDPRARQSCIEYYGDRCQVCGIDFGERYGNIGKGFIHVHHLTPLSEIAQEYQVDPIVDLRPVCPNCHSMLHTTSPPMSLDDLKKRLNQPLPRDRGIF